MSSLGTLVNDRVVVDTLGELRDKDSVLARVADLMAEAVGVRPSALLSRLRDREALQSTGLGDGVAIPHCLVPEAHSQVVCLVLCGQPIEYAAIDGKPVRIVVGVVGPPASTSSHLKLLARISRWLRPTETREALLRAKDSSQVSLLIAAQEHALGGSNP